MSNTTPGFMDRFLANRDQTGRYVIISNRTGRRYLIEPIDDRPDHQIWGDVDPATKKITGSYGDKHRGSIRSEESMITEENGVSNVTYLDPGESPESYIERVDSKYPSI